MSLTGYGGPKYERVKSWIREQIESGAFPAGHRLPSQEELPKLLKVGGITVRRALSDLVQEGLLVRRRRSGTFVADRTRPPLIPAITGGVLHACQIDDAPPHWLAPARGQPTTVTWAQPERRLKITAVGQAVSSRERHPPLETVAALDCDGLLSVGVIEDDWLGELVGLGKPTVLVDYPGDRHRDRADQVFADPLPGYRAAVRELARRGMKRIHYVGAQHRAPADSPDVSVEDWLKETERRYRPEPDAILRQGAFQVAMSECGLPVQPDWIHFASYTPGNLEALAERLAKLPAKDRPEALVCHNLNQAQHLMALAAKLGLVLEGAGGHSGPSDGPGMAIAIDGEDLGAVAVELLLSRLQRPLRPFMSVGVTMSWGSETEPAMDESPRAAARNG
jgi:DNA-binding LacI/PurR family transcriptional regulator